MNFDIEKPQKWPIIITIVWLVFTLALAGWWFYLIITFGSRLESINFPGLEVNKIYYMAKWEGVTFFVLLAGLGSYLIYLYNQTIKKSNSLSTFFASLTHELKTPLSSVKLQTEVIQEMIKENNHTILPELGNRLIEDCNNFELELNKILNLSRVERGGSLYPEKINLVNFTKIFIQRYPDLTFSVAQTGLNEIFVDKTALEIILKNLIENTKKHGEAEREIFIKIQDNILTYFDQGNEFTGDINSLGKLFYKFNSKKGSGIGLYLIKKLMKAMKGRFSITQREHLTFTLEFFKSEIQ